MYHHSIHLTPAPVVATAVASTHAVAAAHYGLESDSPWNVHLESGLSSVKIEPHAISEVTPCDRGRSPMVTSLP